MCMPNQHFLTDSAGLSIKTIGSEANLGKALVATIHYISIQVVILGHRRCIPSLWSMTEEERAISRLPLPEQPPLYAVYWATSSLSEQGPVGYTSTMQKKEEL